MRIAIGGGYRTAQFATGYDEAADAALLAWALPYLPESRVCALDETAGNGSRRADPAPRPVTSRAQ